MGSTRKANALMLHFGRCGSTVIGNQLRQHPGIVWDSEILQARKQAGLPECVWTTDPRRLIELRSRRAGSGNFGFELKPLPFMHLSTAQLDMNLPELFQFAEDLGITHVIFLTRRHYLRQLASLTIAVQKGLYEKPKGEPPGNVNSVRIKCAETAFGGKGLIELFQTYDRISDKIRKTAASSDGFDFMELEYAETVLRSPKSAYASICRFLGLEDVEVPVRNRKVNAAALEQTISNFPEVREVLAASEYSWMTETDE